MSQGIFGASSKQPKGNDQQERAEDDAAQGTACAEAHSEVSRLGARERVLNRMLASKTQRWLCATTRDHLLCCCFQRRLGLPGAQRQSPVAGRWQQKLPPLSSSPAALFWPLIQEGHPRGLRDRGGREGCPRPAKCHRILWAPLKPAWKKRIGRGHGPGRGRMTRLLGAGQTSRP